MTDRRTIGPNSQESFECGRKNLNLIGLKEKVTERKKMRKYFPTCT